MQNESITQIDYRHPLPVITPWTMATYRQTNRRGFGWRPMACLIVAESPNSRMVKIRIAGWYAMKRCYKEVWVHRQNLYPAVENVQALHEEYIKAQIMERVTKRMLAEVKAVYG